MVTGWSVWDDAGNQRDEIDVIDTATGQRRTLLAAPGYDFGGPRIAPDGRLVACRRSEHDSYAAPGDVTLVVVPLDGEAAARDLLTGFDRRPQEIAWAPDSGAVYFTADDRGRRPVYRSDLRVWPGHQADGRGRLRKPVPGAGRPVPLRAAVGR